MARACSLEDFRKNTSDHQLEVLQDINGYRHLRFRKPGTSCYGFDVVTWPGYLAITGDMGASVFSRLSDMFEFFRADKRWAADHPGQLYINVQYWAEKLVANDGAAKAYDSDLFHAAVKRRFDEHFEDCDLTTEQKAAKSELWGDIEEQVLRHDEDESVAITAACRFENTSSEFSSFDFTEFWEERLTDYTYHLIWRMYAVAHAVEQYDALTAAKAVPA